MGSDDPDRARFKVVKTPSPGTGLATQFEKVDLRPAQKTFEVCGSCGFVCSPLGCQPNQCSLYSQGDLVKAIS